MVLEVSIQDHKEPEVIRVYPNYLQNLFTVHVESKRILTVVTENEVVASDCCNEVLRCKHTNTKPPLPGAATKFSPDSIFVALTAEKHSPYYGPRPHDDDNYSLELITLCVGAHCLILELPGYHYWPEFHCEPPSHDTPKHVKAFFQNPRVVVVGTRGGTTLYTSRAQVLHDFWA